MSGLLPALGGGGGSSGGLSGLLTAHTTMQVAAGGLSGLIAMSAAIASGVVPVGANTNGPPPLALVACPDSTSVVAVANLGDRMLITAKSGDGRWLRVYIPGPAAHDGWVRAGSVDLLADGSALPVAACGEVQPAIGTPNPTGTPGVVLVGPTIAATASGGPNVSPSTKPTTAPTATPKTAPPTTGVTAPPPTNAPTATPNVGPVFSSGPTRSVDTILADPEGTGDCWGLPHRVVSRLIVKDPDGVAGVELWAMKPGMTTFSKLAHGFFHYTSDWAASIDSYMDHIYVGGTLSFYAVAIDATGLKTKSKTVSVAVRPCDLDATVNVSIDLPIGSDGVYQISGNCIRGPVPWYANVKDPDGGVKSAVLALTKKNYIGTASETVTLRRLINPAYWYGESTSLDGETTTSWVLTTTDVNGGTTITTGSAVIRSVCIK
jgi:hypothetical protein